MSGSHHEQVGASPKPNIGQQVLNITLDSGATVSYLRLDKAQKLNQTIYPNNQLSLLADMKTRMASISKVDFVVTIEKVQLRLRALVMENLQAECFGGTTFHVDNDVSTRLKERMITLYGRFQVKQSNPSLSIQLHCVICHKMSKNDIL